MYNDYCQVKYIILVLLVLQQTSHVLLLRYSRTRPGTIYLASTAVCCDEAMKLVVCFWILAFTYLYKQREINRKGGDRGKYSQLNSNEDDVDSDVIDRREGNNDEGMTIKHESFTSYLREQLQFDFRMAGIAAIYTVQKNLTYLAISNLDAVMFQMTYQAKILTTALFSVVLLKRKLSCQQIQGLFILTLAVILVQLDKVDAKLSESHQEQRRWVGLLAVFSACCTSGFGGVYFELVLKPRTNPGDGISSPPPPPPSVWAKNLQLSIFAFIIALITAFIKDHQAILSDGFFQGYSPLVVLVITLQALGGLTVAATIKYADNILKNFASASSIVTSALVSALVFGFQISRLFLVSSLLVFISIWVYTKENGSVADGGSSGSLSTRSKELPHQTSEIALCRRDSQKSTTSIDEEDGLKRRNGG
mmetsp:Transcript_10934/g.19965  ORF Transcript_10934/g.19965 Transcript_10934/m.19965 type:complete len:421 (-) Transcript_10934:292-1554(-)|eukprot:CAMPEP_0201869522 /NCGR_PEP_ID=MMETSP0902-20130614/3006_1 /ASSEMBLY_ACC=CAM_ASM_000551 /TAXON_ID=420261 /ORGANISM="Thalassiosira antarctica, Strain CCMP982" /LENGTH=420 /DNA_ID=CAMNT_0048395041 /DNA_START=106 /DNA_END=1368 /DNA_ORIENTATION=+